MRELILSQGVLLHALLCSKLEFDIDNEESVVVWSCILPWSAWEGFCAAECILRPRRLP